MAALALRQLTLEASAQDYNGKITCEGSHLGGVILLLFTTLNQDKLWPDELFSTQGGIAQNHIW
jgi:hypothetical protein